MIEVLKGFPKKVVAFACKGHVTKRDYETVLIPAVEETLQQPGKVRLYYQIGPDFSGIEARCSMGGFQGWDGTPSSLGAHRRGYRP